MERNLLLKIQYDGSAYHGWQVQENARSVQGVFQEALKQVCIRSRTSKRAVVQIPACTRGNSA